METIKCIIERVIFSNAENGYSVFQVKLATEGDEDDLSLYQTLVGMFQGVSVGCTLVCDGDWRTDKRFGRQFVAETWHEELPATIRGLEKYLGSGLIRGIGARMAKVIVRVFGKDTLDVLTFTPERLLEVPGIGKDRMKKIRDSWDKQRGINDVMVFLQGHGVSSAYAVRIYKEYGNESIEKVKENPYALADDVFGIGFKMADEIASHLGYAKDDVRRCKAGIVYTLKQFANDGHCFAEYDNLVKSACLLLEIDNKHAEDALNDLLDCGDLILDDGGIFLPVYYYSECNVAHRMKELLAGSALFSECEADMDAIAEETGFDYDEVQKKAINTAVKSKIMVLTGGPGTGKTATTKGIIAALEAMGKDILCAAPTGRAAKRMTEATGKEAKTIHRMLEYNPQEGFARNADNPLEGDALIVDECSMIDISLMNSLMKAVPLNMRVVFVGDIDQLPSVGAGNVLRDVIDSNVIPVVRLTHIFRQAQTSRIVTNAHKINQGVFPDVSNGMDTDFFFLGFDNADVAADEIVNLVKNRIPKAFDYGINDIQVLVPMKNGAVGTKNLNIVLQEAVNPEGEYIQSGMYKYRVGDKVMQIKNNYQKNIFNGDVGTVVGIDTDEHVMTVSYDKNEVEYESSDMNEVTLAYAVTIHKSQGSEYPVVIIPLFMSHYIMLQRNLVYTGITRAKKLCIVLGEKKALAHAVRNMVVSKRNTRLKERLCAKD